MREIGQSPFDYESVFSHFHQDFATGGRGNTAGLYAPEEMALDLPRVVNILNHFYGTIYSYGYNSRYGFGAGKSAALVLFYDVILLINMKARRVDFCNWTSIALGCPANMYTNRSYNRLSFIIINCETRIFQAGREFFLGTQQLVLQKTKLLTR